MGIYDDGFIFDHTQQLAFYYYQDEIAYLTLKTFSKNPQIMKNSKSPNQQ
jgi:hypothetical protein